MNNVDGIKATGRLEITLTDGNGAVKQHLEVPNLVVTVGKSYLASRAVGTAVATMSHMAVGTQSNSLTAADTALQSELIRVSLASSIATTNVIAYVANFPAGVATGNLVEAGIFNAASAGTMMCRTTFPSINKEASDTLAINWNLTIN